MPDDDKSSTKSGFKSEDGARATQPENAGSGFVFSQFLGSAEGLCNTLSKHQLEALRATIAKIHAKRFRRRKEPKYGSINKGFTELELQHFLRNVPNEKFRLLFKYQAFLGLRVGEVSKLRLSNINLSKRELTIESEKSRKMDSLLIPQDLFKETIEYIAKNEAKIKASDGYVFFKENDNNHNNVPYIDLNYVRKVFREAIKSAGLDQTYGYSDETTISHRQRPLYRLTTHSLRHYAITHFSKSTNGNVVLTSRFARHSSPTTTMRYISKDNEELYKNIDYAFYNPALKEVINLQKQIRLYK